MGPIIIPEIQNTCVAIGNCFKQSRSSYLIEMTFCDNSISNPVEVLIKIYKKYIGRDAYSLKVLAVIILKNVNVHKEEMDRRVPGTVIYYGNKIITFSCYVFSAGVNFPNWVRCFSKSNLLVVAEVTKEMALTTA